MVCFFSQWIHFGGREHNFSAKTGLTLLDYSITVMYNVSGK